MFAIIFNLILFLAETHEAAEAGGFTGFYNKYLNYPGFEAWKFLNLTIFVLIMIYLLKKPLSEGFKAKRDAIRADLIRAEEEKQAALAELTSVEAKVVGLENEKTRVMENARLEAAAEKNRIAEQTAAETARLREQAENEIARIANQNKIELRRFSAEESIRLAEEKIRAAMNGETDAKIIKSGIQTIGGLN